MIPSLQSVQPPDLNLHPMTSTASSPIVLPDRFSIDREIGRGGMAVVYGAHDHHLSREVAIKVLAEELSSALGIERFQREIDVMAKLVHPGIVSLFDSGEADELGAPLFTRGTRHVELTGSGSALLRS